MIVLIFALVIIAGISKAVMDKIQFHFSTSIFKKYPKMNPKDSWKKKWYYYFFHLWDKLVDLNRKYSDKLFLKRINMTKLELNEYLEFRDQDNRKYFQDCYEKIIPIHNKMVRENTDKNMRLAEYYSCLSTLVKLKEHKEENGKTDYYIRSKENAWKEAKRLINE